MVAEVRQPQLEQRVREAYARHQHNEQKYCLFCAKPLSENEKDLYLTICLDCVEVDDSD